MISHARDANDASSRGYGKSKELKDHVKAVIWSIKVPGSTTESDHPVYAISPQFKHLKLYFNMAVRTQSGPDSVVAKSCTFRRFKGARILRHPSGALGKALLGFL